MNNCPFATQATIRPRETSVHGTGHVACSAMAALILAGSLALFGCASTSTEAPATAERSIRGEHVSGPSNRLQVAGLPGISLDLTAKPSDLDIDGAFLCLAAVAAKVLDQPGTAQGLPQAG